MSVNQFPQFGAGDQRPEGEIYAMQPLPHPGDWPREAPGTTRREVPPLRPQTRQPRNRWRWFGQALLALLLLALLSSGSLLYYLDQRFAGRIYPNLSIRGVPVGQMTPEEASAALYARYTPFLEQPLTLTYGDQTWMPSLDELGIRLAIAESVQHAYTAGRGHGLIDNLREVAAVWQNGLELPLFVTVDQTAMQRYILARATEIEQTATNAGLIFEGTLLGATPARTGRQTLVNDTLHDITAAVQTLEPQTVALRTQALPPLLDDAAVAETRRAIAALIQEPLLIEANGKAWEWSAADLAQLLRVERVSGAAGAGDRLAISIDREEIRRRIAAIANATEDRGKYARVDWNGGDLRIIRPGEPGRRVDEARAEELVLAAFNGNGPQRAVDLPFVTSPPAVTADNLDQLGITHLLAVGRSDFTGSAAYRVTNIQAGMRLLHGILLAPGDEFSFNNNIGSINAANGFVEGYAIIQNRTQLEWGGGICQDSTTMFRAAFWAGLPITERWGHSFYISWYDKYGYGDYGDGPGMDATIFTGGPDLKFLNDTGNWLLIQTYVDLSQALTEVRIYGTPTGREISLEGPVISNRRPPPSQPVYVADPSRPRGSPRQSDTARGGMDITFTRIIKQDGMEVQRNTFVTRFRPWPNIFEVNPADLGPDGRLAPREPAPPPPAEQPPAEQPPAEQPPAEQPPAEQPPAEQQPIPPPLSDG